jgi:hypothetical protein
VVKGESTAVVALGFFLAVLIVIEAFVPFSGAHFNPVVSIVMCLCQVVSVSLMMLHILVQFAAGIAAAYMMKALIPNTAAADCAVTKIASEWQDGIGRRLIIVGMLGQESHVFSCRLVQGGVPGGLHDRHRDLRDPQCRLPRQVPRPQLSRHLCRGSNRW